MQHTQLYIDSHIIELYNISIMPNRSQANDLALRIAKTSTGHTDVLVFENAFHGCLEIVSKVSPRIHQNGQGDKEWLHVLPVPDFYR